MGKLAADWKSAKDSGEKAAKEALKAGKKAGFPTFKSDFQKNLDRLEAAHAAAVKTIEALKKQVQACKIAGVDCKKIAGEYRVAIKGAEKLFDGPSTRSAVLGKMSGFLANIDGAIDDALKELPS